MMRNQLRLPANLDKDLVIELVSFQAENTFDLILLLKAALELQFLRALALEIYVALDLVSLALMLLQGFIKLSQLFFDADEVLDWFPCYHAFLILAVRVPLYEILKGTFLRSICAFGIEIRYCGGPVNIFAFTENVFDASNLPLFLRLHTFLTIVSRACHISLLNFKFINSTFIYLRAITSF